MNFESGLSQIFNSIRRGIADIWKNNIEAVSLLANRYIQNDVVLALCVFEPQVDLTYAVDPDVAGKLVVVDLDADLEQLCGVSPMKNACLLGENFECTKVFTLGLDHSHDLEGPVHHEVSGLEADKFWKWKWLW